MKMMKAKMKALEELMDHMRKMEGAEEDEQKLEGPENPSGKMEMDKSLEMMHRAPDDEEEEGQEDDEEGDDEGEDMPPLSEREEFMKDRKAYMQRGLSSPMKGGKAKVIAMSLKVMPKGKIAKK